MDFFLKQMDNLTEMEVGVRPFFRPLFFLKQMDNLTEMEVGVRPFFRPLPGSPKNV